jgi:uncharacterized protein (DUF849 family)
MKQTRYGRYSTGYGAAGLLIAYAAATAGLVPESDIPLIAEATGTALGAAAGCLHAHLRDDGTRQTEDQTERA